MGDVSHCQIPLGPGGVDPPATMGDKDHAGAAPQPGYYRMRTFNDRRERSSRNWRTGEI
ncbi:hypothetical protein RGR602_PC01790 (plasmid) [Rhizobium gallicum bv. gallicum R602sp]|uniref:Uncharacterized protein n=1 Tax=Rhizobium gallicum bv. gallicum R602sp TaxID=1041138 RepID=A0A0B4XCS1_9HYPH|nr:hypothetical protein RGR602_PC01790 [Rhizobium gallicum bv. gallicum R602sp]